MRVLLAIDGSACSDVAVDLVSTVTWPDPTTIFVVEAYVNVTDFQGRAPRSVFQSHVSIGEVEMLDVHR